MPSPVSIYTCIAELKATVGQRIATFREERNQMWHVLTALIYSDLSSILKERSLAQRKCEGPRARNTSQSKELSLWPLKHLFPLRLGTQLLHLLFPQMGKTAPLLPERHVCWYTKIRTSLPGKRFLISLVTWFTREANTFYKFFLANQLTDKANS